MSLERALLMVALAGLVIGAALGAGCMADEAETGGRESATQPPVPDQGGVSGGTPPAISETTLPIPIPIPIGS